MDELKAKWTAMSLPTKILTVLGFPLVLLLLGLRVAGTISQMVNTKARTETDEEAKKLATERAALDQQTAKSEGRLEEIQSAESEALKDAKNEKPNNFFNDRFSNPK